MSFETGQINCPGTTIRYFCTTKAFNLSGYTKITIVGENLGLGSSIQNVYGKNSAFIVDNSEGIRDLTNQGGVVIATCKEADKTSTTRTYNITGGSITKYLAIGISFSASTGGRITRISLS